MGPGEGGEDGGAGWGQDGGRAGRSRCPPAPRRPCLCPGHPPTRRPRPRSPRAVALRCRRLTVCCPGSALGCGLHRGVSAWPGPARFGPDAAAAVRPVRFGSRFGAAGPARFCPVRCGDAGPARLCGAQLSSARHGAVRCGRRRADPAPPPAPPAAPAPPGAAGPPGTALSGGGTGGDGRTDGRGVGRTDGDGTRIRRWGRADTGTAERGWGRTDGGRRDGRVGAELSEPLRPLKGIGPRFGAAPPPTAGHSGTGPAGHGGGLQPPQKGLRAALRGRGAPSLSLHPEQQQLKSAAAINSCRQRSGVPRQHPHTNTGLTAQPLWAHWG